MIATYRTAALSILVALSVAGCRGGEDTNGDGAPDDGSAMLNAPPEISGTPAAVAAVGERYTFEPAATDSDGDVLTFKIANRPGWATFSATSGKLTGMPPADAAARYEDIRVSVTDGASTAALPAFSIVIEGGTAANAAPAITGTPATKVVAGHAYAFQPQASDADGDSLTFAVSSLPSWLQFDVDSGRLYGTPSSDDAGVYGDIVIRVTDGIDTTSLPAFSIEVTTGTSNPPTNTAPTIAGVPPRTVVAGHSYRFLPAADDVDGQTLRFTISGEPAWASFSTATGLLSGTPSVAQVGVYDDVKITVSDGIASAVLPAFSITVLPANTAPTISGSPPRSVTAGTAYTFQPTASDPDGQTLTFRITNKPAWATFNAANGRLWGTPTSDHAGTYANISITVTDGIAQVTLGPFSIEVIAGNRAPVLSGSPPTSVTAGVAYDFRPSAQDPDGDALTYSISGKPAWASFSSTTGRLYGTPALSNIGAFSGVTITVSDGKLDDVLGPFTITVKETPTGSATLRWSAPETNEDGTPLTDLRGYRVYYGQQQSNLASRLEIPDAAITSATVEELPPATWYFAVRAYADDGTESAPSNIVSKTIN
jgi:hypothetical protein